MTVPITLISAIDGNIHGQARRNVAVRGKVDGEGRWVSRDGEVRLDVAIAIRDFVFLQREIHGTIPFDLTDEVSQWRHADRFYCSPGGRLFIVQLPLGLGGVRRELSACSGGSSYQLDDAAKASHRAVWRHDA